MAYVPHFFGWIAMNTARRAPVPRANRRRNTWMKSFLVLFVLLSLVIITLMIWWSFEPDTFSVKDRAEQRATASQRVLATGSITTDTMIDISRVLLDKPGGYLSNDITPPAIFMDNMPNWEFGVLVQVRDMAKVMRNEFSRSQSQSIEDPDLSEAEPLFNYDHEKWMFLSSESQYRAGIKHLESYRKRLNENPTDAAFYARADNLVDWLAVVEKRLGSLSQRLSASVGQVRENTDFAGDASGATQHTPNQRVQFVKTPWLQIDDVFYEARGSTWALLHLLKAVEVDFADVIEDKNATASLKQIIRELEETQKDVGSPMILNGSPFGFFANHSLVMANYISRANAAIIDLRKLLENG